MKQKLMRASLPPQVVRFAQSFLKAGADQHAFFNLFEWGSTPRRNRLELALLIGAFCRLGSSQRQKDFRFTPIALGWELDSAEPISHDLTFHPYPNQNNSGFCSQHRLTQLQPKLDPTTVSILEAKYTEMGLDQLKPIHGYNTRPEEYLQKNQVGLGIAHAEWVLKEIAFGTTVDINYFIPLYGPSSVGRSVFILLDYTSFLDLGDKTGKRTFGWLELRVMSEDTSDLKRFLTTTHKLNTVIPAGSFVVVANTTWFKKLQPDV